jgi:uncharacterized protein YecE (DUF72 family)
MVDNWNTKTPKNFKFTAKFPKVITHEKRLKEIDKELDYFLKQWVGYRTKHWP